MNWGRSIVIGMAAFMLFITGSVIYMVRQDTDTLEEDDYYDKGVHYNDVYVLKENLQKHDATPTLRLQGDSLCIQFTSDGNNGVLRWKRPSDGNLDSEQPFETSSKTILIPLNNYTRGHWQIEINWKSADVSYQSAHNFFIP